MEISVFHEQKIYSYIKLGKKMTWVDEWQVIVPTIMHQVLRQQALKDGADPKIFTEIEPTKSVEKKPKKASLKKVKTNVVGGFNPFQKSNKESVDGKE